MTQHSIWFDRPAESWTDALPLGNGRIGAMVFGGPLRERLQINDGTAWSGSPANEDAEPRIARAVAGEALHEAREAISAGEYTRADAALKRVQHRHSQTFLPFVDLGLEITSGAEVHEYRRRLDFATATHETTYLLDGSPVGQRTFISHQDGVLVHEVTAGPAAALQVVVRLSSPLRVLSTSLSESDAEMAVRLKLPADVIPPHDAADVADPVRYDADDRLSLQGAAVVHFQHDGVPAFVHDEAGPAVRISGATSIRLLLSTETTFAGIARPPEGTAAEAEGKARERVRSAARLDTGLLLSRHLLGHSTLYDAASAATGDAPDLPIDERLRRGNADPRGPIAHDPALAGLLFNFGRYLLIASSRAGGVPANLQGIWNDSLQPVWSSNYTTNINLEMNYWMAEVANLDACLPPLFDLIDGLRRTGTRTARELYGAPGWAAHHNTDIWAYSLPVGNGQHDPKWAFWPLAGPWLVRHLWDRVLFGGGDDFLRERAWGPIRSAAEFALAWLVEFDDGSLGTLPSTSPENQFYTPDRGIASAARSSTFDVVVIGDLLDIVVQAAGRLGIEHDPVVTAAVAARPRLPGPGIGRSGTVKEWIDDFEFPDPTHRHVGHLYFLHPSDWRLSSELAAAASASLDERGDESTGWSLAWKLVLRARLGQAGKTGDLMRLVFRDMEVDRGPWIGGLYPNLFAAHPPFQIDGNFGFVTGLAECVLQSHSGRIELLKAVPRDLPSGSLRGLRARPGITVDVVWAPDGSGSPVLECVRLEAAVESAQGVHLVCYDGREVSVDLRDGPVVLDSSAFRSHSRVAR